MKNKRTAYICLYLPRQALTCPPSLLLYKIHDRYNQTCPSRAVRTLLFASLKNTLTWDHIASNAKQNGPKCAPQSDRNSEQNSPKWPIWEHCVPFTDRNSEQNSPKWPIWEQCAPFTHRNSEQNSPNLPIGEQFVPFTNGNSEQNGAKCPIVNKLFHLQMGTRNKTALNLGTKSSIHKWEFGTKQS